MTLNSQPAQATIRSEITVTPLVDVCLVLLIIFMVVAPILNSGVKVDLPKTAEAPAMPGDESQIAVSIAADGSVYVRSRRVADSDLSGLFSTLRVAELDPEVIVRADRHLGYERVSEVLATLSEAGFKRVGLVTERR